jgi:glucose-1-phosphate adenylyltransferase
VLAIVLAGGEGKRLMPLTADRAKPAVPFGGQYRLVDFVLSNLANAGFLRICVLTQYKSHSLDRHITTTWRMSSMLGNYVTPVPAQQRLGPRWYTGSADAIFQSLNLVFDERPDIIVVFGADHVYRMDPAQMVARHVESGAGVTVAGIRVPRTEASGFGIIETGSDGRRITRFLEKPANPPPVPDDPDVAYASMGNYVFSTDVLLDALRADANDRSSVHDMGGNIIPLLVDKGEAAVYDFADNEVPGTTDRDRGYWRDVGTLDSYYDAHMDLVSVHPVFNLFNTSWPILTATPPLPPAKFTMGGFAPDSMVSAGCIVSGAEVRSSVLAPDVRVVEGAYVEGSVLMPGVRVGAGAVVKRTILDKNVTVPPGARLGEDLDVDRKHYRVTESGIVVLGKGEQVIV